MSDYKQCTDAAQTGPGVGGGTFKPMVGVAPSAGTSTVAPGKGGASGGQQDKNG